MKITKKQLTKITEAVLAEVDMAASAHAQKEILNILQELFPDNPEGKKYFLNGLLNKVN